MTVTFTSYCDWIDFVFDHPEMPRGSEWHWQVDAPYWNSEADPLQAVQFISRLFSEPETLIGRFTAQQIGTGIHYLVNPSLSDHAFVLLIRDVPIELRLSCIRHIEALYQRLFRKICPHYYGHLDWGPEPRNGASGICYMFWDVFPMCPRTKNELMKDDPDVQANWDDYLAIEETCLSVLENTLLIEHPACQEGGLHGLGEWHHGYPERVRTVIDQFLKGKMTDEIRAYARRARVGAVL